MIKSIVLSNQLKKRLKVKMIFITLIILTICLTGCSQNMGTFTIISTRPIDWTRTPHWEISNQVVKGQDLAHVIIIIPTKLSCSISGAVNNALRQIPGAVAMVNATVHYRFFYIPFIYGQEGYIVRGRIIYDSDFTNQMAMSYYFHSEDGLVFTELTNEQIISLQLEGF